MGKYINLTNPVLMNQQTGEVAILDWCLLLNTEDGTLKMADVPKPHVVRKPNITEIKDLSRDPRPSA